MSEARDLPMKLLGVSTARSIWLFPAVFLNPLGKSIRGELEEFRLRYKFRSTPLEDPPTKEKPGAKWTNGEFETTQGPVIVRAFTIHEDGFVVDMASSTENGEAFAEDALEFMNKLAGMPTLKELPAKKIYLSEVFVQFKAEPKFFVPGMDGLLAQVSALIADDKAKDAKFMSLYLGLDQSLSQQPLFRFEREINTKAADNRYYSLGPIPTGAHLNLLESIEKNFA